MRGYLSALLHMAFGFITTLSILIHPVLSVLCFLAFIIYEYDEERHLSDAMYEEISEYATGMAIAILMLLGIKIVTRSL